jgi:hypothetical protein
MKENGKNYIKYKGLLFEKLKLLEVNGGKSLMHFMMPWWYKKYYVSIIIKDTQIAIFKTGKSSYTTNIPDKREYTFYYKTENEYNDARNFFQNLIKENEAEYLIVIP